MDNKVPEAEMDSGIAGVDTEGETSKSTTGAAGDNTSKDDFAMEVTGSSDSQSTLNPGETNDIFAHPFLKVLRLELVAEKLLSYLNFEDVKALSEVSMDTLRFVRKSNQFADRARLDICKDVIKNGLLKECTFMWKHLSLDVTMPIEVVDVIDDVLKGVETLQLKLPRQNVTPALTDNIVAQFLVETLIKCESLKNLELDIEIMSRILIDVFSNVKIQKCFSGLQRLSIYDLTYHPSYTYYLSSEDGEEDLPFQRNFFQLSLVSLNLKKFVFGKVLLHVSQGAASHVRFIPNIIEACKDTLEDLEVHLPVWGFEEMKAIRCPKLKRLVISTSAEVERDSKIVETFIKNQPPLVELTISIKEGFPVSIILSLQTSLTKKMKKLHLKAKHFEGKSGPMDWKFLETIPELRDFSIRKPESPNYDEDSYGYGEDFLLHLPSRTEKIALQGFSHFWRSERRPEERNIGEVLSRFESLKEVNFLRSYNTVTDDGLQQLITTFPGLTSLTFSHCYDLTNFGITGVKQLEDGLTEKVGVALDDLKGLITLKIRSCPNIEPDSLLSVAKFKYLREFDYYRNYNLSKEFLFDLCRQNPCLEHAALHLTTYDQDADHLNDIREELKKISNRVHFIEILGDVNWEIEDSDSDASTVDDDDDSNFSGGPRDLNLGDLAFDDDYDESPDEFDEDDDDVDDMDFY